MQFPAQSNNDIDPCLTLVMPVYNEAATIDTIIELVLKQRPVAELIIVDDASTDTTWQTLESWPQRDSRVRLLRHPENRGKGAALRTGITHASKPYVLVQDADMEYDPAEYYVLLNPMLANKADVVMGSRFMAGTRHVLYYWHAVGNMVLTTLSNMTTNLWLTDMETCYKLFRREIIQGITLEENRFGFEPEVVAKIARLDVRIYEVPISYSGRTYADGKKINWKDGVSALRCIAKYGILNRL